MSPTKANKPMKQANTVKTKEPKKMKVKTPDKTPSGRKPKMYNLPVYKVKKIMKTALASTRGNAVDFIAQDAIHLAIKATEGFMMQLIKRAYAGAGEPQELKYDHVAEIVQTEPTLAFPGLRELVPRKQKYEVYLQKLKAMKKANPPPMVGWMECDKFDYNETREQRIKRLMNDKYCGTYYRMIFTGDKSCLRDRDYLKYKMKMKELRERLYSR